MTRSSAMAVGSGDFTATGLSDEDGDGGLFAGLWRATLAAWASRRAENTRMVPPRAFRGGMHCTLLHPAKALPRARELPPGGHVACPPPPLPAHPRTLTHPHPPRRGWGEGGACRAAHAQ